MTEDEIVLTHILRCSKNDLHLRKPRISPQQQEEINAIKARRAQNEPLQYILGEWEFFGLPFKVDPRVLIPRPETELLVEKVLEQVKSSFQAGKELLLLDIGTGSGNIPVALAKHLPGANFIALDRSADALAVARENSKMNGVLSRIALIEADVFSWLDPKNPVEQKFSVVVSNPPYIRTDEMKRLPKDVQNEPTQALDGGEDGLKFYKHIIANVHYALKPGGWLFFEIGETQGKSLENLLTRTGSFVNIQTIKDLNGRDRIIKAQIVSSPV